MSVQQQEMDGRFVAMHHMMLLVRKHSQKLPETTQRLFDASPRQWKQCQDKIYLARQRLGPKHTGGV